MAIQQTQSLELPSPVRSRGVSVLGWVALVALIAAEAFGFATSVPDRDMGNLQKIMYVHVPAAWTMFIGFAIVFGASVLYLWKGEEKHDLLASSAAEATAVFTALTLVLGSIWGKPTWGVWWTWDARLTSTAVLLVIIVGYLALREFTDDDERRAKWSAAIGILGAINVPIVYMSVRWWKTLHQIQSSPATVDPMYALGLRLNAVAFSLVLWYFVAQRYRAARLERETERLIEERAFNAQ
jgi:heme exporter protein C